MLKVIFSALISYLIGSFPTCYLVIKQVTGDSIFKLGDGNMGGTNVLHITGSLPVTITAVLGDVLKGYLSAWLSTTLLGSAWLGVLIGGVFSILGHNYSIWVKFRGGKGGAATIGSLLYADPLTLLLMILWGVFVKLVNKGRTRMNETQEVIGRTITLPLLIHFVLESPYAVHAFVFQLTSLVKYATEKQWNKKLPWD